MVSVPVLLAAGVTRRSVPGCGIQSLRDIPGAAPILSRSICAENAGTSHQRRLLPIRDEKESYPMANKEIRCPTCHEWELVHRSNQRLWDLPFLLIGMRAWRCSLCYQRFHTWKRPRCHHRFHTRKRLRRHEWEAVHRSHRRLRDLPFLLIGMHTYRCLLCYGRFHTWKSQPRVRPRRKSCREQPA